MKKFILLLAFFISCFRFAFAEDIAQLLKKAGAGDVDAQAYLGVLYDKGLGVPQDYAQAAQWYLKAANQNNTYAQFILGFLYDKGQGVPQDYAQAAQWYLRAANQNDEDAQNKLGLLYEEGKSVTQSNIIAYALYNVSASVNTDAQQNDAIGNRDRMIETMTQDEINQGQKLSQNMIKQGVGRAIDVYEHSLKKARSAKGKKRSRHN